MNRISSFLQFILGFSLGVLLLAGGTTALGFLFLSRMTSLPAKPVFTEEKQPVATTKPTTTKTPAQEVKEEPSPTPSPETEEPEKPELPPGAYKAKVNWSEGLSIRSEPNADASRIGGFEYNQELIILETSSDGKWQKARLAGGEQEGWIKAGNVEKITDEQQ